MPKSRSSRPNVEGLMPDVEDDIRSTPAKPTPQQAETTSDSEQDDASARWQDDKSRGRSSGMSTYRQSDKPTHRQDGKPPEGKASPSRLAQQIAVLMEGPATPMPSSPPQLNARANGYLSEDVEQALQQATAVLKNNHSNVSKSLILDHAVRLLLWDLKESADDSRLVQWLNNLEQA